MITQVQILRNDQCNWWTKAKEVLEQALKEKKIETPIEVMLIKNDQEAQINKFFGSPQVNINGQDIDPHG